MLLAIVQNPKRHIIASSFKPFWVKIHPRLTSVGEPEKKKRKKNLVLYFTYSPRHSLTTDWHKFLVTCSFRGCNQLCKVLSQSVKGLGFCEGSNFDHSHWIAMSPLTLLGTNLPAVMIGHLSTPPFTVSRYPAKYIFDPPSEIYWYTCNRKRRPPGFCHCTSCNSLPDHKNLQICKFIFVN